MTNVGEDKYVGFDDWILNNSFDVLTNVANEKSYRMFLWHMTILVCNNREQRLNAAANIFK